MFDASMTLHMGNVIFYFIFSVRYEVVDTKVIVIDNFRIQINVFLLSAAGRGGVASGSLLAFHNFLCIKLEISSQRRPVS